MRLDILYEENDQYLKVVNSDTGELVEYITFIELTANGHEPAPKVVIEVIPKRVIIHGADASIHEKEVDSW